MDAAVADGIFHATLAVVGLIAWALAARARETRFRKAGFAVVLVAGLVSFPGFDRITGQGFLHPSELFHYVFGAKYFPELGYTGLYDATTQASADLDLPMPDRVRDLVTSRVEHAAVAQRRGARYAARFSAERWLDLEVDLARFDHEFAGIERDAILDHGFNATPPWIALARRVVGGADLTRSRLVGLAAIDVLFLACFVLAIAWGFGFEATAKTVLFVGTAYSFRFAWIGGSLLRFDWVLALGLAMAALSKGRHATAGAAIAWATASRIFPAFFAVAAGCSLLAGAIDRREKAALVRFTSGFLVMLGLAFLVGAATGRGPVAYREFAERFETHRATWASNHIGFESLVVADRIAGADDEDGSLDPFAAYGAAVERARVSRKPVVYLALAVAFVAVARAARRLRPEEALPLGAILCFSISTISGYYWVMLALAPLVAEARTTILLVACTFLHVAVENGLDAYSAAHVLVSLAFTGIFVDWLVTSNRRPLPSLVLEVAE